MFGNLIELSSLLDFFMVGRKVFCVRKQNEDVFHLYDRLNI